MIANVTIAFVWSYHIAALILTPSAECPIVMWDTATTNEHCAVTAM